MVERLRARSADGWSAAWIADALVRLLAESDAVLRPILLSYFEAALNTHSLLAYDDVELALAKWLSRHGEYSLQRWSEALPTWSAIGTLLASHLPSQPPSSGRQSFSKETDKWPVDDLVTAFQSINLLFSLLTSMHISTPDMPKLMFVLAHILGHQLLPRVDQAVPRESASATTSPSPRTEHEVTLLHTQISQSASLLVTQASAFVASFPSLEPELTQTSLLADSVLTRLSPVWQGQHTLTVPEAAQDVVPDPPLVALIATRPHLQLALAIPALLQGIASPEHMVALQTIHCDTALVIASISDPGLPWDAKLQFVQALARTRLAAPVTDEHGGQTLAPAASDVFDTVAFELLHAATVSAHAVLPHPGGAVVSVGMLCAVLPALIKQIPLALTSDLGGQLTCDSALRAVLLLDADLFRAIESFALSQAGIQAVAGLGSKNMGLGDSQRPIRMHLLRSMEEHHNVSVEFVHEVSTTDPAPNFAYSEAMSTSLAYESEQQDLSLTALIEQKAISDPPEELLAKLVTDFGSVPLLVAAIKAHITASLMGRDVEAASSWCSALIRPYPQEEGTGLSPTTNGLTGAEFTSGPGLSTRVKAGASMPLDIVMLFCTPEQLIRPMCTWLANDCTSEYAGEEARAVGGLVLFLQFVTSAYGSHLTSTVPPGVEGSLTSSPAVSAVLRSAHPSTSATSCSAAAHPEPLVSRWVTALFGSEGISDSLLQDSPPHVLVQLTPILFDQSILAAQRALLDSDTLHSGLTYFLEAPLHYTLPAAIFWLVRQLLLTPTFTPSGQLGGDLAATPGSTTATAADDIAARPAAIAPASWVHRSAHRKAMLSKILVMLLRSDKCPLPVRAIVAPSVVALPDDMLLPLRDEAGQPADTAHVQAQVKEDKAALQRFQILLKSAYITLHRGPGSDGLALLLRASQRPAWTQAKSLLPPCFIAPERRIETVLSAVPAGDQDLSPFVASVTGMVILYPDALLPASRRIMTRPGPHVPQAATLLTVLVRVGLATSPSGRPSATDASRLAHVLAGALRKARDSPLDVQSGTRKALLVLADAAARHFPFPLPPEGAPLAPETHGWEALKQNLQLDHQYLHRGSTSADRP